MEEAKFILDKQGNIWYTVKVAKAIYTASADSAQDPPVPIPNTEVKLSSAENTWVETPREDREVLAFLVTSYRLPVTGE